jgi:hypothetical protein
MSVLSVVYGYRPPRLVSVPQASGLTLEELTVDRQPATTHPRTGSTPPPRHRRQEIDEVVEQGLTAMTEETITDPAVLREHPPVDSTQGYAVNIRESGPQICAIGAAVLDDARRLGRRTRPVHSQPEVRGRNGA